MPKRIAYTKITPLPANVPRQLAIDMLHSHGEIIELNPLVTGHTPIQAPRDAARDEYFAQWYEIEEIITWGFGMKKKIAFKGCFHDLPWGLQTHIYAPMGVDLRNTYQIAGNQPGEPKEVRELGVEAPAEGLYLKETVEITCNIALASFVKKETKQTLLTMIERMTRKAELLDDGVLHAMFENGRLKTMNPTQAQNRETLRAGSVTDTTSATSSPATPISLSGEFTPAQTFTRYANLPGRMNTQRNSNVSTQGYGAVELDSTPGRDFNGHTPPSHSVAEMEGSPYHVTDDKTRYPYHNADAPPIFHAELADTSDNFAPRRLSGLSFTYSEPPNSVRPTSTHSQLSNAGGADPAPHQDARRQSRITSGSNYVVTNPDQATPYPNGPDDYAKASNRASTAADHGLSSQVTGLNISGLNAGAQPARTARCPMENCTFQGDSAAVSHHVNRQHFS